MKNYKVLLVDDEIDHLRVLVSIIENHLSDFTIFQAQSGKDVLHILENNIPDIIISDWEMPNMSGLELASTLQQSTSTSNIPIIIVSGINVTAVNLKEAFESGAIDFLRKPVNPIELLARINAAITIAQKHQNLLYEREQKILENAMLSSELKSVLIKVQSQVAAINTKCDESVSKEVNAIITVVSGKLKSLEWKKYSGAYSNIHPEFIKRLLQKNERITPTEIEICQMLRLGLSNKEIADLLCVAPESMRVSRSRLRKKLGLESPDNLQTYLCSL